MLLWHCPANQLKQISDLDGWLVVAVCMNYWVELQVLGSKRTCFARSCFDPERAKQVNTTLFLTIVANAGLLKLYSLMKPIWLCRLFNQQLLPCMWDNKIIFFGKYITSCRVENVESVIIISSSSHYHSVVDVKDGRKFPGVKLFFGHEIVNGEKRH